jgi:ArsR family transcriptional regulator
MRDSGLKSLETVMKALADPTRLRIVGLLANGEVCVCDIHESLGIPQPKTSRHLAYLRRSGLVNARKDGLWVHYRLAALPDPVVQTVLNAAAHAVGHLSVAGRDRKRLAARIPLVETPPGAIQRCCDATLPTRG